MFLIIGLGNPGEEYAMNRHNIGFMVLDSLQKKINTGDFHLNKKFQSALCVCKSDKFGEMILAKPQTFMNDSGKAVSQIARYYNIGTKNIIVIHDELDLLFNTVKISINRGPAGHNGIKSIINRLNAQDFIRVRVGIGIHDFIEKGKRMPSEKFVLKNFTKKEQKELPIIIERALFGIQNILANGIDVAMNEMNQQNER